MKWSWRVGEFLGIRVYVHATFVLLIGWIALTHFVQGQRLQSALAGIAFTATIFLSVLLHEYGHALAARRFGIGTRDITLLPIGGVARLERMPQEPKQELGSARILHKKAQPGLSPKAIPALGAAENEMDSGV